jgi:hypothetical protein
MKRIAALSLALVAALIMSCDMDPAEKEYYITYNGATDVMSAPHVSAFGTTRTLVFNARYSNPRIEFNFDGFGDPTVAANQAPQGNWTAVGGNLKFINYSSLGLSGTIDSPSTSGYTLSLTVSFNPTTETMVAHCVLNYPGQVQASLDYSGHYSYEITG